MPVVRREPDEVRSRVQGRDDVRRAARMQVRAPRGIAGDRRVREEREMVLAPVRADGTAGAAAFRDRGPRVARRLDQVHQRRMIEIRMVSVSAHAERARTHDRDVVRLGRIRDARPTLRERVLVRELRHVRSRAVDLVQVLVLHEHDDELIEIAGRLGGNGP